MSWNFSASYIARGFVGNDHMQVASTSQSAHTLSKLLAQLVVQYNVGNPSQLRAQFIGPLSEDMAWDAKSQGSDGLNHDITS